MKKYTHLLDSIEPVHYQLDLTPDLKKFTFSGHETITFKIKKATAKLTWHAEGLDITQAKLDGKLAKIEFDAKNQTVSFSFDGIIKAGEHKLDLEYSGQLKDNLHGFYRSQYIHDGKTKYLATTQFEATHAREAFICIDEPAAKATFEVTLTVDKTLTAISNTNIIEETIDGGNKTCHFATTPRMSTYLLAFIVGDLKRVTTKTKTGIEVGVCVTPDKIHQSEFALQTGRDVLDFFEDYFGIPYPLPKLDMIAIPDFGSGAMENWGAVTYRETAILVDPKQSSINARQWTAMVIAHELAHQWFGNLVTMKWWTDLWLNEGFASWIEYLAVDHLHPDWRMWDQFVAHDYQYARQLDCLASTHPIEIEVNDPGEINEIFDAISYQKGAAVIRMLHEYLGPDDFKRGLQSYLKRFSYGNTATTDLWHELEKASGKPVRKVMSAWTKQAGYPMVSFADGEVMQRQFFTSPVHQAEAGPTWPIPLRLTTPDGIHDLGIVEEKNTRVELEESGWIKPNSNQSGFFISRYSDDLLGKLAEPIKTKQLSDVDRFGVVADITQLNEAGYLGADVILRFIESFKAETNYIVWSEILILISRLAHITTEAETYDQLKAYGRELLASILGKLGYEQKANEHHFDSLLRPAILTNLGLFEEKAVINHARELFCAHQKGDLIEPNLRSYVYLTVARHGARSDYDQLEKLFVATSLQEEQRRIFTGLARFKQPELIDRALDFSMSEAVRPQDSAIYLATVLSNRYGHEQGWQFIQQHWPTLTKRYAGSHLITLLPTSLGQAFTTEAKAREIESFFSKNMVPGIERSVAQAVEKIKIQDAWRKRDEKLITKYLQQRQTPSEKK